MKRSFLTMLLLALVGIAGNLKALAQEVPEPTAQWKFDNPSDLMAAKVGSLQLVPAVAGNNTISTATVAEAGIEAAQGPTKGSSAIFVPAASALKVVRAEGAASSTSFTFMMDIMVPDAYPYNGLFQTNQDNANDSEFCIHANKIGANAVGGYYGGIRSGMWYRVALTNSNGSVKLFVNGTKLADYETSDARWEIDPTFYLLCDNDGEKTDTYISEISFWETPLTDEQVAAMEFTQDVPWITSLSQIKEGDQFHIVSDRIVFAGTKTGKLKAMASAQPGFSVNWGDQYVYWGDLDNEADGFIWTAEKAGDQWAFLNKEKNQYLGNMNTNEADVIFSETPVGYTLTDLREGEGCFYMANEESEHSLHVQGYLMGTRPNNSLAKQEVGDDNYRDDVATAGYPGRWRLIKLNADEPVETGTKIETAADFEAFAQAVSDGETDIDAYLAADIELTGNIMVGNSTNQYAGTFDGKGYTITYNYTDVEAHNGLFRNLNGATIRNLFVKGTAVVQGIHFGALVGDAAGDVLIENVVTDVDITGDRSGVTGDGGMAGYLNGNITFNNCATLGAMGNSGTSMYCGFVAFATGTSLSTLNNCYTACSLTEGTGTSYCYTFCRGTNVTNNCYYVNAIGEAQGTQIAEDQIASGELCYKLNGDQSEINWYQTLGEDAQPAPFDSHAQVYANGELKCDGTSAGGELVYSNSASSVVPPHTFEGGWCTVCGTWNTNYLTADSEGFYNIGSANDLAWIAEFIAQGNTDVNIKLTADIDLTTSNFPATMIGNGGKQYAGTFDGQEHTVKYSNNITSSYCGLFAYVNGATIRNLRVEGDAVSTAIHFGALIGQANGTVLVENVVTDVDITGKSSTGVQGDAGMLGANYANITFNNCATLGEMGYEGSSMYSSFSGWSNGTSNTILNNCYTLCKLTEGTGTGNCFTLTHAGGPVELNNCYYLNEIGTVQGTAIAEDLASGAFCYKLNGDQSVIGWYQTIGKDALPVPFASHAKVYANGTVRCDGAELPDSPVVYSNTEGQTVKPDHQYGADGICTVCGSLKQNADGFYVIDNAAKLNWFAGQVASGATAINAVLAADIDLCTSEYPDLMIGNSSNMFGGIFDGQGHTVTYSYSISSNYCGLFSYAKNATIRNLIVKGDAVVTAIHFGALIGRGEGTILVENVITDVDITGQRSSVTGDGGMIGALYANITFNNCATLGKLGYSGSSMYSGFSGYSSGTSSATLNNCYTISELTEGTGTGSCFTFIHGSGAKVFNNCYYVNAIGTVQGTAVEADEVANGSLAAKLGAGWYQNIGEDAYPVLDKTHAVVKEISEAGYAMMYIPDAVEIPEDVEVYTGSFEETWLKLDAVEGTVPAWEPVVLKGAPGIYSFMPAAASEISTEVVFADLGFENAADLTTFNVGGLTFSFDGGGNTNTPKYYDTGAAARIYGSNSMTITAAAPITKIEFTFGGTNYAFKSGGYEFSNGTYALATKTWTGSAESITIKNTTTSQWRIVSMTITYEGTAPNIAGNVLKGAKEDIEAAGKYILAKPEGEAVGFYLAETGNIKAGKAYLELTDGADVKAFFFSEGDDATGINEELRMKNEESKGEGAIYNLAGQRLGEMQNRRSTYVKGINIVGGKKILK